MMYKRLGVHLSQADYAKIDEPLMIKYHTPPALNTLQCTRLDFPSKEFECVAFFNLELSSSLQLQTAHFAFKDFFSFLHLALHFSHLSFGDLFLFALQASE